MGVYNLFLIHPLPYLPGAIDLYVSPSNIFSLNWVISFLPVSHKGSNTTIKNILADLKG